MVRRFKRHADISHEAASDVQRPREEQNPAKALVPSEFHLFLLLLADGCVHLKPRAARFTRLLEGFLLPNAKALDRVTCAWHRLYGKPVQKLLNANERVLRRAYRQVTDRRRSNAELLPNCCRIGVDCCVGRRLCSPPRW